MTPAPLLFAGVALGLYFLLSSEPTEASAAEPSQPPRDDGPLPVDAPPQVIPPGSTEPILPQEPPEPMQPPVDYAPPPPPPEPPPEFGFTDVVELPGIAEPVLISALVPEQGGSEPASRRALAMQAFEALWRIYARGGAGQETDAEKMLIASYQNQEGLQASGTHNRGTGKSAVKYLIVPPPPFYWPSRGTAAAKKDWTDNMNYQAGQDPSKAAFWRAVAIV